MQVPIFPPKITIITPYKDSERFIPTFVQALKAQTFIHWLCLMVDDYSSDNSNEILKAEINGDRRFSLERNTSTKTLKSPASARNYALELVQTELIAFCDIDDFWHPTKLERQIEFHESHQLDVSVSIYARFKDLSRDDKVVDVVQPPSSLSLNSLLGRNPIPLLTVILSANCIRRPFQQIHHEDFLFWIQLYQDNPNMSYGCLREVLAFYRLHNTSQSARKHLVPIWTYKVFRAAGLSRIESFRSLSRWISFHSSILSVNLRKRNYGKLSDYLQSKPYKLSSG